MQNNKSISVDQQQQQLPCRSSLPFDTPPSAYSLSLSLSFSMPTLSMPHYTLQSSAFISLSIALHFRPHIPYMI